MSPGAISTQNMLSSGMIFALRTERYGHDGPAARDEVTLCELSYVELRWNLPGFKLPCRSC
jgi:hypothetical protein